MKQRIRNEHKTCVHEQKKPEKKDKARKKATWKKKELLTSNITPPYVPQGKCLENNKA
jgi:hypothetical protein